MNYDCLKYDVSNPELSNPIKSAILTLKEGKYKDLKFQIGAVSFPDLDPAKSFNPNIKLKISIEYNIISIPDHFKESKAEIKESSEFNSIVTDIVISNLNVIK